jgi:hypothetical protein
MPSMIHLKPARPGLRLIHPTAGALPEAGGAWPADQFTFRRLRDGDVERIDAKVDAPSAAPAAPAEPEFIPPAAQRRAQAQQEC